MSQFDHLIARLEQLMDRVEGILPAAVPATDWSAGAFRWRPAAGRGYLQAIALPHKVDLNSLQNVESQKQAIIRNTAQFVAGRSANNVLLTGARGTGKSTLIKACWNEFAEGGLKIIGVDKTDLIQLADVASHSRRTQRPYRLAICQGLCGQVVMASLCRCLQITDIKHLLQSLDRG